MIFYRRRYKKEHPEADPRNIRTAKHFARLLGFCAKGKGGRERASDDTIYNYWRRFFSIWDRLTCAPIPDRVKDTVKNVSNILRFHLFIRCYFPD